MEKQLEVMVNKFNEIYSKRPGTEGESLTSSEIINWWVNNQHRAVALITSQRDGKTRTYCGEIFPREKIRAQYILNDLVGYAAAVFTITKSLEPFNENGYW